MKRANNDKEDIIISSKKVFMLIKLVKSYRKELNKVKGSEDTLKNIKTTITKLNNRKELLDILFEKEGVDTLIDTYKTKLTSLAINNANNKEDK